MGEQLIAAALALTAALLYAVSNVLEQRKAAEAPPETSMRVALFWHLARQPLWWLGIFVDVGGLVFQIAALGVGSLVFVQPILVLSLPFSLLIGAAVGSHHMSGRDTALAFGLVASLSIFLAVGAPDGGLDVRSAAAWVGPSLLVGGFVTACLLWSRSAGNATRAALFGAAAGAVHGVNATLMKGVARDLSTWGFPGLLLHRWEPWALAALLPFGFLMVQSAFQAGDLRAALPSLEVAEPLVASALGLFLLHEHLHATTAVSKGLLALTVVVMAWTTIELAQSAAADRAAPGASNRSHRVGAPPAYPE
jgi:hypothetical protein